MTIGTPIEIAFYGEIAIQVGLVKIHKQRNTFFLPEPFRFSKFMKYFILLIDSFLKGFYQELPAKGRVRKSSLQKKRVPVFDGDGEDD